MNSKKIIEINLVFLLIVINAYFLSMAHASSSDDISASNKLEKFFSMEDAGITYTALGNKIVNDNKRQTQATISLINLPRGAEVIKSYIFWTGRVTASDSADTNISLLTPNNMVYAVYADDVWSMLSDGLIYACRADVTKYINKNGGYRLKDIELDPPINKKRSAKIPHGEWLLMVLYKAPGISSVANIDIYNGIETMFITEKRPRDVIFYIKETGAFLSNGNYLKAALSYANAVKKYPRYTFSYTFNLCENYIITALYRSGWFTRPLLAKTLMFFAVIFIIYAISINTIYLLLILIAAATTRKYLKENKQIRYTDFIKQNKILPVSIIISAFNEELSIKRTVDALLRLKYPEYEIIVINDGSRDDTLNILKESYNLRDIKKPAAAPIPVHKIKGVLQSAKFNNLFIIDKENSGKADSLNAGINLSSAPLFCTIDADTILEEESLFQLALPILKDPEAVVATTGMVRLHNGCVIQNSEISKKKLPRKFLELIQVIEYIRAYGVGRIGWNIFNAHVIVSGTFSLYKKDVIVKLGGYNRYAIGEDVELNMRLQKAILRGKKISRIMYVPSARCLTQAPADLRSLARQRNRWHQGLLTSVKLNMFMFFNPKYGYLGMIAVPFYALFELLAPAIELFGYIIMPVLAVFNLLSAKYMLVLLGIVIIYGICLSLAAILLDIIYFRFYSKKSYLKIIFCSFFESFGFHQMTVFWRMRGIFDYFKDIHVRDMGWHSPDRVRAA